MPHSHSAPVTDFCVASLPPPQERFQLEGAKCLIWNQHNMNVSLRPEVPGTCPAYPGCGWGHRVRVGVVGLGLGLVRRVRVSISSRVSRGEGWVWGPPPACALASSCSAVMSPEAALLQDCHRVSHSLNALTRTVAAAAGKPCHAPCELRCRCTAPVRSNPSLLQAGRVSDREYPSFCRDKIRTQQSCSKRRPVPTQPGHRFY